MFCLPAQLSGSQIAQMLHFLSVIILPFQNFSVSSLKGFIQSGGFINLFKCISQTKQVSCFKMSRSRSRAENILQNTCVQAFQGKAADTCEGSKLTQGCALFPKAPAVLIKKISSLRVGIMLTKWFLLWMTVTTDLSNQNCPPLRELLRGRLFQLSKVPGPTGWDPRWSEFYVLNWVIWDLGSSRPEETEGSGPQRGKWKKVLKACMKSEQEVQKYWLVHSI